MKKMLTYRQDGEKEGIAMNRKIKANCYYVDGWWRYYRTADGEIFSLKYGHKIDYFYHGNVFKNEDMLKYLNGEELEKYLERYDFVEN